VFPKAKPLYASIRGKNSIRRNKEKENAVPFAAASGSLYFATPASACFFACQ
jgi:hypothetical protein